MKWCKKNLNETFFERSLTKGSKTSIARQWRHTKDIRPISQRVCRLQVSSISGWMGETTSQVNHFLYCNHLLYWLHCSGVRGYRNFVHAQGIWLSFFWDFYVLFFIDLVIVMSYDPCFQFSLIDDSICMYRPREALLLSLTSLMMMDFLAWNSYLGFHNDSCMIRETKRWKTFRSGEVIAHVG